MSDCIRAQITANLKAALAAIATTAGYSFTIGIVEEERQIWNPDGIYPYLRLEIDAVHVEPFSHDVDEYKIPYVLKFVDQGNDQPDEKGDRSPELTYTKRNVIADLVKAVMVDHTRGGLAETTRLTDFGDGIEETYYWAFARFEVQALVDALDPTQKG